MTTNLDATSLGGTTFPAQVTVYDSLGTPHIATVTYTQTGINTWGYSAASAGVGLYLRSFDPCDRHHAI